jgi:hypothetical protein
MYGTAYAVGAYDADGTSNLQALFSPPFVYDIPNYLPTDGGARVGLWRHYKPKARGVNVYLLSDGTIVQDTATAENSETSFPLPYILNDPSGPYAYTTNWDGTIEEASLPVWIMKVYEGGHVHQVTASEAALLSEAGYSIEYV